MFRIILGIWALGIASCAYPPEYDDPFRETTALCENAGVQSRLDSLRYNSTRIRENVHTHYDRYTKNTRRRNNPGVFNDDYDKYREREHLHDYGRSAYDDVDVDRRYRRALARMNNFDAEVDVLASDMTSVCKVYARCMEKNDYDEGRCRSSDDRWGDSRSDMTQLARELDEIEAETERLIAALDRPIIIKGGRKGHPPPYVNRCECDQSVGGVFANCCDRDSDSRYGKKRGY